ncbi:hypothetical protein, partial [Buttiauxella noackiae]|uniref:hypothetical protein n=1 Tax=Buttiauxella noackiae TaxID=82992 RepID=UPI000AFF5D39
MIGFFGRIRKKIYKYASVVVSLTNKDVPNYVQDGCNCVVIENPIDQNKIHLLQDSRTRDGFIAVGRICHQKNYERMLNIFSYLIQMDNSLTLN